MYFSQLVDIEFQELVIIIIIHIINSNLVHTIAGLNKIFIVLPLARIKLLTYFTGIRQHSNSNSYLINGFKDFKAIDYLHRKFIRKSNQFTKM